MASGRLDRPTPAEFATAVRVLDWVTMQVEEEDRGDIAGALRFARAFTERIRQGAERHEGGM